MILLTGEEVVEQYWFTVHYISLMHAALSLDKG
jgi:hypothetical protein